MATHIKGKDTIRSSSRLLHMRQLAWHHRESSRRLRSSEAGLNSDYRLLILIISPIIRDRSRISVIWPWGIDIFANDDNSTYACFVSYCTGGLVIWDRVRRDRWRRSVVAAKRPRCQRWSRYLKREWYKVVLLIADQLDPSTLLSRHISLHPSRVLAACVQSGVSATGIRPRTRSHHGAISLCDPIETQLQGDLPHYFREAGVDPPIGFTVHATSVRRVH